MQLFKFIIFINICLSFNLNCNANHNLTQIKENVKSMFEFAYFNYMKHAYPYDELRPITCDGHDTWGSFSLTLIDALDTLVVMGMNEEFQKAVKLILKRTNIDRDRNVSVFETNIRVVGGLLGAHLLSKRGGITPLEPGWPCAGPLLRLSESVARRLLPAFNTKTGMPYGTVNLKYGIPPNETPVTCTAGVTTFIVEFGALSRLTGDPVFEETALRALRAMWKYRSQIGLVGNHIDVEQGKWTAIESGIGSGIDSYFEYLLKGSVLLKNKELKYMFDDYLQKIDSYIRHDDWHFWVKMDKGSITQPIFQSLEAFWPGILTMTGDLDRAMRTLHNYHQVWKSYGATPEFYNIAKGEPTKSRSSYPLRPELIESIMYVYRSTRDPTVLQMAVDIYHSINTMTKTKCGFATVHDVLTHQLENRMESFFLSETLKYLYLIFDENNFLNAASSHPSLTDEIHASSYETVSTLSGGQCIMSSGGYVFNTEAHPIDPGALYCCHSYYNDLVYLDQMHNQYPLLRLLNISETDMSILANENDKANLAMLDMDLSRPTRHIEPQIKLPNDDLRLIETALLGCPNTKFHYRFLFSGQVFKYSLSDEAIN